MKLPGFLTRKAEIPMDLSGTVKTEPRFEMAVDPNVEGSDVSFERGTEDMGPAEGGSGKKRKVFPHHITSELRTLYKSGMIGVGIQYSSLIDAACERTGLSRAQVKSWIKRTKYHQKRVLRQEEDHGRGDGESYSVHTAESNAYGGENPVQQQQSIDAATADQQQTNHHHHQHLYASTVPASRGDSMEPVIETNRLVIVDDDPDPPGPLPHAHPPPPPPSGPSPHSISLPTRKDVIPALERHILTNETMKGSSPEHIKTYISTSKRPKQVTMVAEDLTRGSTRNEAILAAVQNVREHKGSLSTEQQQQLYTTTPIPQHAIQVTQHIPLQTAILQPVTFTSHASHPSAPPALVMTNGGTTKVMPPMKESPQQEASRLFKKIERNFKRLDELGYQGFAFSIHGDDTQLVYSGPIGHCFTSPLISYLRAVIIAANPPPLLPHISNHINPTAAAVAAAATTNQQQTHVSLHQSPRQQLYMYDTNPSRVQQRTAIYELSEADSVDENGDRDENEYETVHMDGFVGANGKAVHVVVTQDPNYLDNGAISD